jgi:hypothetical protein
MVPNGSFEEGGSQWLADGGTQLAKLRGGSHTGDWAAYMGDRNYAEDVLASAAVIPVLPSTMIDSATLTYAIMGATTEDSPGEYDGLGVYLISLDEGQTRSERLGLYTDNWAARYSMRWQVYTHDVKRVLTMRPGWSSAALGFIAVTDESLPTGWLIDTVDLEVCYWETGGQDCSTVPLRPVSVEDALRARPYNPVLGSLARDLLDRGPGATRRGRAVGSGSLSEAIQALSILQW